MASSPSEKTNSNAAGISELVRKLTEVRHRVERMQLPLSDGQSKDGDEASANILYHDRLERFWKRFMKPITLRFRDNEAEDVFISIAQTIAPVPGRHRHEHTSWKTATMLASLRAFLFAVAFVIVHWVLNPYILEWTTLEDQSLVPDWMAVTVYAICLGVIGVYAALVYQQYRLFDSDDKNAAPRSPSSNSPLSKVIRDMFSVFPGKVPPVLSALCGAIFFIIPFIFELASDRRGSLLIHVVLLSIWSAFYLFPSRFVDSALGAFAGLVIYFGSLISQWDSNYFSLEIFGYYVVLAAFFFYAFGTQKYYREKAQRIQFFSNLQQRSLERDTRAIRNMKAHLITMQYPDFILRQQQRGEVARQAISTIIFAQVRIFRRTSVFDNIGEGYDYDMPSSIGVSSADLRGGIQRSAAAGVVSSPLTPYVHPPNVSSAQPEEVRGVEGTNEELEMLNSIFVAFDKLSKSYGVDKIKNVGQSWVGACGLDDDTPDSFGESGASSSGAQNILKFAVACMERISTMPTGKLDVRLSIGIGTETTVAGIFGSGIHQYEAVGDAVTEAHLLSTLSQNSIAVAQSTLRFVGQHFFVSRFAFQESYPMPRISNHHGYTSQYYRRFSPERTQEMSMADANVFPNPSAGLQPSSTVSMFRRDVTGNADESGTESYAGWSKFSYDFDFGSTFGKALQNEEGRPNMATSLGPAHAGTTIPMTSSMAVPMTTQSLLPASNAPVPATMGQGIISSTGLGGGALGSMPLGVQMSTAYPIGSGISPQVQSAAAMQGTAGMVSSDMMAAAARGEKQGNEMDEALQKKLKSLIQLGREIKQKQAESLQAAEPHLVSAGESHSNTDTVSSSISQHDSVGEGESSKDSCMLKLLQHVISAPWFQKTPFYENVVWFINARRVHPAVTAAITRAHATAHVTLVFSLLMSIAIHISAQGLTADGYLTLAHQWVVVGLMLFLLAIASMRAVLHVRYVNVGTLKNSQKLSQRPRDQEGHRGISSQRLHSRHFGNNGTAETRNDDAKQTNGGHTMESSEKKERGALDRFFRWLLARDHAFQLFILAGLVLVLCAEQVFLDIATATPVSNYDDFCIENIRSTHWIISAVALYILTLSDFSFGPAVKSSILLVSFWLVVVTLSWSITRGLTDNYTVALDGKEIECEDIAAPLKIWIVDVFLLLFNILTRYRQELAMMRMALSQWGMQTSRDKTRAQSDTLTKAFRVLFPSHVFRLCVEDEDVNRDGDAPSSPILDYNTEVRTHRAEDSEPGSSLFTHRVRGLLVESVHGATVLVVNMIPLQSLVGLLQPTDLFAVFATLASVCDEAVEMYGGKRARIVGNLFIAVFGLPEASESSSSEVETVPPGVRAGRKAFDEVYYPQMARGTDKRIVRQLRDAVALTYQKTHSAWSSMSACNYINRQLQELSKEFGVDIACSTTMHTGPVLSGLLGSRAVRYDIYGPTVFQAEEMAALVRKPRLIALSDSSAQALLRACTWFGFLFRERWPLTTPKVPKNNIINQLGPISKSGMTTQSSFVSVLHWDPEVDMSLDNCSAIAAETVKFQTLILPDDVASFFDKNNSSHNTGSSVTGATPMPECETIPMNELQPLLHFLLPIVDEQQEVLAICLAQPRARRPHTEHFTHPDVVQGRSNYDEISFATVSSGSLGLYGIPNSDLVGKKLFDMIHPFDQDAFCQTLDVLMSANHSDENKYPQNHKFALAPTAAVVLTAQKNGNRSEVSLYDREEDRYVEWWEVRSWTAPVVVSIQHRVVCAAGERRVDLMSAPSVVQWRWASTTMMEVGNVLIVLTRRLSPELAAELSSLVPGDDPGYLEEYCEKLYGEGTLTSQGFVLTERSQDNEGSEEEKGKQRRKKRSSKQKEAPGQSRVSFEDFKLLQGLGAGQYATVYLALHKPSGNVFAIKRFNATQVRSKSLQAELKALSARQRHPNVVDFLCCLTGNDEIWLVMEHVRGIPLDILLQYAGKLDVQTVKLLLSEVLLGVGFLHSLGILHRDVAEKNLMITREGHVKIIDFGLSVLVNPLKTPNEVAASMNTPSAFMEGGSAPSGSVNDSVNDTSSVETNEASQGSASDSKKGDKRKKNVTPEGDKMVDRSTESARELKEGHTLHMRLSDTTDTSEQGNSGYKSNSDSLSYSNAFEKAANAMSQDSPFSENLVALLQSLIPAPDNRVVKRLYTPQKYRLAAVAQSQQAQKQDQEQDQERAEGLHSIPEQGSGEQQTGESEGRRGSYEKATTVLLLTLDDGGQFIQYLTSLYASQHASQAGIPPQAVADGAVPGSLKPSWLSPRAQRRDVAASLRSKSVHLVKVSTLAEAETVLRRDAPIFDAFVIHCLGHPEMALPALQMRYALSQEVSAASQLPAAVIFTAPAGEWQQLFAQKYAGEGAAMCVAMPFSRQSLRAVCLLARHTNEQREAALKRMKTVQHSAEDNAAFKSTKEADQNNTFADNALLRMGQQSTGSYAECSKSKGGGESGFQSQEFAGLMGDDFNRMKSSINRAPLGIHKSVDSSEKSSSKTSGTAATKQMLDQLGTTSKGTSSSDGSSVRSSGSSSSSYFDYINTNAKRSSPFITSENKGRTSRPSMKFGVANSLGPTVNTIAGTPHYMAPETLMRKTGLASDYFAVGVLAFRLLSGFYPFSGNTRRQVQENVMKNKINWSKLPPGLPQEVVQLLHALLHPDPAHRLGGRDGVSSIMAHPFFSDIDWSSVSYNASPLAGVASKLDPFGDEFDDDDDTKMKNVMVTSGKEELSLQKSADGTSYGLPSIANVAGNAIAEVPDSSSSESSATRKERIKQTKDKDLGSNNSEESLNAQVPVVGSGTTGLTVPNVTSIPRSIVDSHSTKGYSVNSGPTSGRIAGDGNFQTGYEAGYRKALEDARAQLAAGTSQPAVASSAHGSPRRAPPFGGSAVTKNSMGTQINSAGTDMFGGGGHYATAFSPHGVSDQRAATLSESGEFNNRVSLAQTTPQSGSMGNQLLQAAYSQYDSQGASHRPPLGGGTSAAAMWNAPHYSGYSSQSGNVPGAVGRTTNMAPMSQSVQFASGDQSLSGNWASPLQPGYDPGFGGSAQWPGGADSTTARFAETPAQRSGTAPFDRRSAFPSQHSARGGIFASGELPNLPQSSRGATGLRQHPSGSFTSGQLASGQFPDLSSMDGDAAPYPRMEEAQFGSHTEAKASGSIDVPVLPYNTSHRPLRPPPHGAPQSGMLSGGHGISRLSSETSYMEEETE